jgi:hypothetical protein
MRLSLGATAALVGWGEHEKPLRKAVIDELVARGLVRVLHLKCEPEPIRMLTTPGFEERDRLRAKARAR